VSDTQSYVDLQSLTVLDAYLLNMLIIIRDFAKLHFYFCMAGIFLKHGSSFLFL